ncbi:MAG: hypothetical protein AAF737_05160 [Pseudomonadota bacterium]
MNDTEITAMAYAERASEKAAIGEVAEAAFLYTHAYVLALEAGEPEADIYRAWLVRHGREAAPRQRNDLRLA